MTDLPAPLVAADVDLRSFKFMPLHVARLRDSDLAAVPDGEVFRANVLSWCVAWHQVPAGSLPDDDATLARLLGYGRDVKGWRKLRAAGALRGYVLCSDGRLYHPVVCEAALEAWKERRRYQKAADARWKRDATHRAQDDATHDASEPSDARSSTDASHMQETGTGIGTGNRQGEGSEREGGAGAPPPPSPDRVPRGSLVPIDAPSADLLAIPPSLDRRRATRLPEGWVLPEDWRHRAIDARHRHGMPAINLDLEAEKFANYWHAQPGAKGTKLDWAATWQNWALRADGLGRGGVNGAPQMDDAALERELDRRMGGR